LKPPASKQSPTAPKHLSAEAKQLWAKLQSEFVIDDCAGRMILQSALEAFDRVQEARLILAKEGSIATDRWGQRKAHPATLVEASARAQMHSALRLLKLAPGDLGDA
jgi:P27 family predicted phage terminase small subunit